jgi:hypothetical protein
MYTVKFNIDAAQLAALLENVSPQFARLLTHQRSINRYLTHLAPPHDAAEAHAVEAFLAVHGVSHAKEHHHDRAPVGSIAPSSSS